MSNPISVYDFTLGGRDREPADVCKALGQIGKKFVVQLEQGESGYVHYQGRISLFKPLRLVNCRQLWEHFEYTDVHLSPTSTNAQKGPPFYCTKLDTRIDGPWTDKDVAKEIYIPRQYRNLVDNLYTYQKTIWNSAEIFDERIINYVYDVSGNNGKSTIASLMELHQRGIDLPPINDQEKLVQSVCDILMAQENRTPKVIFIDMPRAMDKRRLGGMYTAIEQIKKGKVFDIRYKYSYWWFDSPQIWVFANIEPELDLLSKDRWRVWKINPKKEFVKLTPDGLETRDPAQGLRELFTRAPGPSEPGPSTWTPPPATSWAIMED